MWLQRSPHFTCKGMRLRGPNRFVLGLHRWEVKTALWPQLVHVCPMCLSIRSLQGQLHFHPLASSLQDFPMSPAHCLKKQGSRDAAVVLGYLGTFTDVMGFLLKGNSRISFRSWVQETREREDRERGRRRQREETRGERREWREDMPCLPQLASNMEEQATQHPKARRGQGRDP